MVARIYLSEITGAKILGSTDQKHVKNWCQKNNVEIYNEGNKSFVNCAEFEQAYDREFSLGLISQNNLNNQESLQPVDMKAKTKILKNKIMKTNKKSNSKSILAVIKSKKADYDYDIELADKFYKKTKNKYMTFYFLVILLHNIIACKNEKRVFDPYFEDETYYEVFDDLIFILDENLKKGNQKDLKLLIIICQDLFEYFNLFQKNSFLIINHIYDEIYLDKINQNDNRCFKHVEYAYIDELYNFIEENENLAEEFAELNMKNVSRIICSCNLSTLRFYKLEPSMWSKTYDDNDIVDEKPIKLK